MHTRLFVVKLCSLRDQLQLLLLLDRLFPESSLSHTGWEGCGADPRGAKEARGIKDAFPELPGLEETSLRSRDITEHVKG